MIYIFMSKFISEYFAHASLLLLNIPHIVLQHLFPPLSMYLSPFTVLFFYVMIFDACIVFHRMDVP